MGFSGPSACYREVRQKGCLVYRGPPIASLSARLSNLLYTEFSTASWKGRRPGPEATVCLELVSELRAATLEGRLHAVWFHVMNESTGAYRRAAEALARALGRLAGVPDYIFLHKGGCICIEMKAGKNTLSDTQKRFRQWCEEIGIPYYVCYTAAEALTILETAKIYEKP